MLYCPEGMLAALGLASLGKCPFYHKSLLWSRDLCKCVHTTLSQQISFPVDTYLGGVGCRRLLPRSVKILRKCRCLTRAVRLEFISFGSAVP